MGLEIKDNVLKKFETGDECVLIPEGIVKIAFRAFYESKGLRKVEMPNSVVEIGKNAFSECWDLEEIHLSENIERLDDYVFYGCSSLAGMGLPKNLKEIGKSVFASCSRIQQILIPEGVTTIGQSAFSSCFALRHVSIPDSVVEIGKEAFFQCLNLYDIVLPNTMTEFEPKIFGARCGIEVIVASGITPDKIKPAWKSKFVAGYIKSLQNEKLQMDSSWEKVTADMIKKSPDKLYAAAAVDMDVLNYLIDKKAIKSDEVATVIEMASKAKMQDNITVLESYRDTLSC